MDKFFYIDYSNIKDAPNILYLNDDGQKISKVEFQEDLKSGYRAGMLLLPVSNAIQLQIAMMTPYHKDHYEIDPVFIIENYNTYLDNKGDDMKVVPGEDEFYIGEVLDA